MLLFFANPPNVTYGGQGGSPPGSAVIKLTIELFKTLFDSRFNCMVKSRENV